MLDEQDQRGTQDGGICLGTSGTPGPTLRGWFDRVRIRSDDSTSSLNGLGRDFSVCRCGLLFSGRYHPSGLHDTRNQTPRYPNTSYSHPSAARLWS
jgi:hypothetical protein